MSCQYVDDLSGVLEFHIVVDLPEWMHREEPIVGFGDSLISHERYIATLLLAHSSSFHVSLARLRCERRNDLVNKLLQLRNLVSPGKAYAQIGRARGLVALQRVNHQASWTKSHKPVVMYPAAVILLQKRACQGFSLGHIGVKAHRRVDTHGEAGQEPPVPRQGLLAAHAQRAAVVIGEIGGDDAITEAGKAVELCRNDLPSVASRDQDGWASLMPGQWADRVLGQLHVVTGVGHGLATPEFTPHDDVFFEILATPFVHTPACLPLARDFGKPPPY